MLRASIGTFAAAAVFTAVFIPYADQSSFNSRAARHCFWRDGIYQCLRAPGYYGYAPPPVRDYIYGVPQDEHVVPHK